VCLVWSYLLNLPPSLFADVVLGVLPDVRSYLEMIRQLNSYLANLTDFAAVSTQPNVSRCPLALPFLPTSLLPLLMDLCVANPSGKPQL
jgi:hypothetical protein